MEQDSVVVNDVDAEEAAFLAEMAETSVPDEKSPEPVVEPVVEEAQEEAKAEEPEAPAVPERKEIIQGYTEEEIKEKLAQIEKLQKSIDSTNGTYGSRLAEQQKRIEELQQRSQAVAAMSPKKLSRLKEQFPEIAEILEQDLSEISIQGESQPTFDPNLIEQAVSTRVESLREEMEQKEVAREVKALTRAHRDWQDVASFETLQDGRINWRNPAFGQWVAAQPADVQQTILNSNDADYLSDRLTEFKEAIKPKAVAKKSNLDAAILPKGLGGRAVSNDLDDEEAAFRAEMARG